MIAGFISAEFLQQQETAYEDSEGNPEVDVGGNDAEQGAGTARG